MRIGLDFDNTLSGYDHVFDAEAKMGKLVLTEWEGAKKQLRNTIRSLEDGDILWQKLQGKVYGPNKFQAGLFPGAAQFLVRCKHRDDDVFFIIHKTEYIHCVSTKIPMRKAVVKKLNLQV